MRRAKARQTLDLEDYRALGAFRAALRRFLAFSEAGAQKHGLTSQQHQALLAIKAHTGDEAMSIGELAQCLLIKNHSAVGLVARLQERGLVEREPSPQDRRRVLLTLTREAEKTLAAISRSNVAELRSSSVAFDDLLKTLERFDGRDG